MQDFVLNGVSIDLALAVAWPTLKIQIYKAVVRRWHPPAWHSCGLFM